MYDAAAAAHANDFNNNVAIGGNRALTRVRPRFLLLHESADLIGDLADREQPVEVAAGAVDLVELDVVALRAQLVGRSARQLGQKQQIGFRRQKQHFRLDSRLLLLEVVELVGFCHPHEMAGVGGAGARLPRLVQSILDGEQVAHGIGRTRAFGCPLVAVQLFRPGKMHRRERHQFERLRQSRSRLGAGVIVAALPVRIELDRSDPGVEHGDDIRMDVQARADDVDHALDELRVGCAPFHGLDRSARCPGHRLQLPDAERIDERLVHAYGVAHRNEGKCRAVGLSGVRIDGRGPAGADGRTLHIQVDQRVCAHHEVFVGIDRLAGADDRVPVAGGLVVGLVASCRVRGPGEEMRDEHGVVAGGVELAVGLVADPQALDRLAAHGDVLRQREESLLREQLREGIAGGDKRNDDEKRAHQISPFVVRSGSFLSAALTKRARMSPASNRRHIGMASRSWDSTSGGVTTAAMMKAPTMTYGRASCSFSTLTRPILTSTMTTMGISNVTPKARNIVITKLKYASMSGAGVIDFGAKLWMNANTLPNTKK